jgi:pyruvate dehydrogenase phosphatase
MIPANAVNGGQPTLAYDSDIPGTRCGPEDGPWPRPYRVLNEPNLWRELITFARPQSVIFDSVRGRRADAINFQPCLTTRTQDRYVVQQLDIHGRMWTLTGVFDGPCLHSYVTDGPVII